MKEMFKKIKERFNEIFDVDPDIECGFYEEEKEDAPKRNISRMDAIKIADKECNLRKSIYKEARLRGQKYGIVEIDDYYAVLVKYKQKYAWYVKVMEGKYGYKQDGEYFTGKLNDKSNIRCIIMADTGEYLFVDKMFDTKAIRMVTDEEYLRYINNDFQ